MKLYHKGFYILSFIILALFSGCQNYSEHIYQSYINEPTNTLKNMDIPEMEGSEVEAQEMVDDTPGELTIYLWSLRDFDEKKNEAYFNTQEFIDF